MNEEQFDRAARAWLDDGPTRMSDRALLSALEEIHTTRQRQVSWPGWTAWPLRIFARVAVAGALVAAVGLLAGTVLRLQPDGSSIGGSVNATGSSGATSRPSASGSPAHVIPTPALTSTFVSPTNGFSFKYLDRGGLRPATELWNPVTQPRTDSSSLHDGAFDVVETGLAAFYKGASTVIPDGVSVDAWVDQYVSPAGCRIPRNQQRAITIDGQSGRIAECPNEIDATVVTGGRLYLFALLHARNDARAIFDAWVATIQLRPEDAAVASATPS